MNLQINKSNPLKKICLLSLLFLFINSSIASQENKKWNFGEKGSKEIVGSTSTGLGFYDFGMYGSTGIGTAYNSYVANRLHIGTSLSLYSMYAPGTNTEGRIGTSFSIGYLFPLSKNFYFDLESVFSIGYRNYFFSKGMDFQPYLATTIKQRFKSILINYGISHSFIYYNSNPYSGSPWSDLFYNLDLSIGISVPF